MFKLDLGTLWDYEHRFSKKNQFTQPSGIFLLATRTTCSLTWRGQVTKRSIDTQCLARNFSCSLPLTWLFTRGETLSLLTLNFFSLPVLPIILERAKLCEDISTLCLSLNSIASYQKYSKTFPNCVVAKIQLHLSRNIVRHFEIVS